MDLYRLKWTFKFHKRTLFLHSLRVGLLSYLVGVPYGGSDLVPQSLHRCNGGFAEVRRLSIHHLHHHDTHRPDIHLPRHHAGRVTRKPHTLEKSTLAFQDRNAFASSPRCHMAIWRWLPGPSNKVFPPETSSLGCPCWSERRIQNPRAWPAEN